MIKLSIKHNFPEVQRKINALHKEVRDKALVSAVNKAAAQAKTAMSKGITSEFNMKAGRVKDALRIRRARFTRGQLLIEAELSAAGKRGRSLNLINFGARPTATGVSFKIKRTGPRKAIRGAFIANKGRTVFIRKGKSRLPIEAKQTIDVAQMFNTRRVNSQVVRFIEVNLPRLVESESAFFLRKFNGR